MSAKSTSDPRRACLQQLQSDLLLGAKAIPFDPAKVPDGMIALGGIYYILPRMTGRPLHSRLLADFQYWMILIGTVGFTVVLTIAGLIQGNAWLNGETIYRILPEIHAYYILRASLGLLIFSGAVMGFYNVIRSLFFNKGGAR